MQDKDLDKLINKAASMHNPAYNEADWASMEALLNKHLPQQKNNKKKWAALLLFIVLSGATGTWYLVQKSGGLIASNDVSKQPDALSKNEVKAVSINPANSTTENIYNPAVPNVANYPINKRGIYEGIESGNFVNYNTPGKAAIKITQALATADDEDENGEDNIASENNTPELSSTHSLLPTDTKPDILNTETSTEQPTIEIPSIEDAGTATAKKPKRNRGLQKLSLNFSMGPDISFINISRPLSSGIIVGGGASYALTKNLTVHSGVYLSNKIYNTDSSGYHPPSSFWGAYPNLQDVKGSCLVYEFPVSATYNFNSKGKNNLFVSAGVSSYIVKKERYTYSYKNQLGQPDKRDVTRKQKEKYDFSVFTISTGIQIKPDNKVAYKVEPFLKVPMSGIGFGNMDLKSTGIMFSINVKPFVKKK